MLDHGSSFGVDVMSINGGSHLRRVSRRTGGFVEADGFRLLYWDSEEPDVRDCDENLGSLWMANLIGHFP